MSEIRIITFEELPKNTEELRAMPQMSQKDPFEVAALVTAQD